MDNAALIRRFYGAFAALDADTMKACYTADARFDDEAFSLRGADEIGAMWRMLCEATQARGKDVWQLEFGAIEADRNRGSAHWEARYRFGADGRIVLNRIDAAFEFRDGLIAVHHDRFDFWRWSRQALGTPGALLGWTPWLRAKVRGQAAARLQAWQAKRG
ncbi:nuclear transport factor 2 family protein [Rivibacter subsaxonicus]|uniref:SnoaL-like protein n=1 Tax=Rivibacter subsaxonicus TaxID=457575 RepID=A0A4Q7VXG1_9BURK|nr:nuclear transport factor 2 family protein [Rivibacter subsaxonicus]RZU01248.1 SnoaL-like protein [Rivibacter subsaxonicus]